MTSRPTLNLAPGTLIERRYEIKRHLGDGGMGTVYLAWQRALKRDVAIKFVPLIVKPGGLDPEELFLKEVEVQAKLKHPNIVEALDGGVLERENKSAEPIGFLVMEFVDGMSLRHKMVERPRERLFAMVVLSQIATGLSVMHSARILHRDLKPENVMVTPGLKVKITDMGNARITGSSKYLTINPRPVGTLHYMPFEQLMNTGMDETVDTFALGVIAFEMLAGYHPRARDLDGLPSRQEVLGPMLAQEPMPDIGKVAPDLPHPVREILNRALGHKPDDRPSAHAMVHVFLDYLEELRATKERGGAPLVGGNAAVVGAPPAKTPKGTVKMGQVEASAMLSAQETEEVDMARYIAEQARLAPPPAPPPPGQPISTHVIGERGRHGTLKHSTVNPQSDPHPMAGAPRPNPLGAGPNVAQPNVAQPNVAQPHGAPKKSKWTLAGLALLGLLCGGVGFGIFYAVDVLTARPASSARPSETQPAPSTSTSRPETTQTQRPDGGGK